jgi:hypothetical protein
MRKMKISVISKKRIAWSFVIIHRYSLPGLPDCTTDMEKKSGVAPALVPGFFLPPY